MLRIGVDVGGTNTDAVLVQGEQVLAAVKTATTPERTQGVVDAISGLLRKVDAKSDVKSDPRADADVVRTAPVMVGTTRFVNAVIERQPLTRTAALRVCLPASASLLPFVDWPDDLARVVDGGRYLVAGGHECDGRELAPLDENAVAVAARRMRVEEVPAVAISSVFSPLNATHEERAAQIVAEEYPDIRITCSGDLGRIGLLERENAALLNASLLALAKSTTDAIQAAMRKAGLHGQLYLTQNDGTVVSAELAAQFPVYSFASGPTNSMRGAALLSGLRDAMVCDIGGTTSDIGCLRSGFPRAANSVVDIGGVRTLFRMPDVSSIGLGGGSRVRTDPCTVGPDSVGYNLHTEALVFGGKTLTASDVAVAAGLMEVGNASAVRDVPEETAQSALANMHLQIEQAVDRMKSDASPVPLLVVGGGAPLAPRSMPGISEVVLPDHHDVANAVGAAMAQISGEADQIFHGMSRDEALDAATEVARQRAIENGASEPSLEVVDREDLPLAYMPGGAIRARVRVVGDIEERA